MMSVRVLNSASGAGAVCSNVEVPSEKVERRAQALRGHRCRWRWAVSAWFRPRDYSPFFFII
jgi:hypothetical protein